MIVDGLLNTYSVHISILFHLGSEFVVRSISFCWTMFKMMGLFLLIFYLFFN